MIQDLNASKISNRKAKISIFFMMYSEYLIGVQCIYLLKYFFDKIDPCECLSNFLVEVALEVYSSNLCVFSTEYDRLVNKGIVECI